MKDIGIMGGAFSPIHLWHLHLGEWAWHQFKLDTVLYIPSGNPPHKKTGLTDKELRFKMVQAAVEDNPHFQASRLEIDREGTSWTIDTLQQLRKDYGDEARLNFIMGEDNVKAMAEYDRRAEFQKLARLLISPRGRFDETLLADWRKQLPDGDVELLKCPASTISSTDVRRWIAAGEPYRYAVPAGVYKIVEEERLYKAVAATQSTTEKPAA